MEGEKAERRMEVRNRGVQWQEVSLAQIFLLWQTAKSLLRSSHWREANRCRRRLSRKIYRVHSHLCTRTQTQTDCQYMKLNMCTCTHCTNCAVEEWEHKNFSRAFTTPVYQMWRVLFASSQMACQSDAGKQGKWEWRELWYSYSGCVCVLFALFLLALFFFRECLMLEPRWVQRKSKERETG